MNFQSIALIFSLFISELWGMNPIQGTIIVKDKNETIAMPMDYSAFEKMQQLSLALRNPDHPILFKRDPKGYSVSLPLTIDQIHLLFNVAENQHALEAAIQSGKLSLEDIHQSDINALQLSDSVKKYLDNLLILKTKDNPLMLVQKDIAPFFKMLDDFYQEFREPIIIPLYQLNGSEIALLYSAIKYLPKTADNYKQWIDNVEYIKRKLEPIVSSTKEADTAVLNLLHTANQLVADLRILAALYDLYAELVPQEKWATKDARLLQSIEELIDRAYPSVEALLKAGVTDFFTSTPAPQSPDLKRFDIKGNIYRLKGLNKIPLINQCSMLYIEDTQIISIEKNDLTNLPKLQILYFVGNNNLSQLRQGCFSPLKNLLFIDIEESSITTLIPGVFTLPSLDSLQLRNNKIDTIKANWAKDLYNVTILTIDEPYLTTLYPGWLNGLNVGKIDFYFSKYLGLAIKKKIEQDMISSLHMWSKWDPRKLIFA